MSDNGHKEHVIKSPLNAWPGTVTLPHPDAFSGTHWQTWKDEVNRPLRKHYARTHLYAYAGLELIAAHGQWDMEIPLAEVRSWEKDPDAERVKLVAWLGRSLMFYMDDIIDPKE